MKEKHIPMDKEAADLAQSTLVDVALLSAGLCPGCAMDLLQRAVQELEVAIINGEFDEEGTKKANGRLN